MKTRENSGGIPSGTEHPSVKPETMRHTICQNFFPLHTQNKQQLNNKTEETDEATKIL